MVALFVVALILSFVVIDLGVRRLEHRFMAAGEVGQFFPGRVAELSAESVSVPGGVFLDRGHTWVGLERCGGVRVGIDSLVHGSLGGPAGVEVPARGAFLRKGEKIFDLSSGGRNLTLRAPVDGYVKAVNGDALSLPPEAKDDPYEAGWLCLLEPTNLEEDLKGLKIGRSAQAWLRDEVHRLGDFMRGLTMERNGSLGILMQDGGKVRAGILESLGSDAWSAFQKEFLAG
jgi:glycine cleavage system H protein